MNLFWSKDEIIDIKNGKTSNRIFKQRTLILSRYSLVLAVISMFMSTAAFIQYTETQKNVGYKISFLNGKIQDYKQKQED